LEGSLRRKIRIKGSETYSLDDVAAEKDVRDGSVAGAGILKGVEGLDIHYLYRRK
jgi:hypothetical protein